MLRVKLGLLLATIAALIIGAVAGLPGERLAQGQTIVRGDVVFLIDESGSMSNDIADVRANVNTIANQLGAVGSFKLGLVGFGDSTGHAGTANSGEAHTHTALTNDVGAFTTAVDELVSSGSTEPGFSATVLGMSDAMGFRPDAGVCGILITDEDADTPSYAPETRADALAALNGRNAVLMAVVDQGHGSTDDDYGPNPGSLAEATGGQTFDILSFRADPQPVLTAILNSCIKVIVEKPKVRRAVLFVNGIGNEAKTCDLGGWAKTGWIKDTLAKEAGVADSDFLRYDYTSGGDVTTPCGDFNNYAQYTKPDTCWSLDDTYTASLLPRRQFEVKGQAQRLALFVRSYLERPGNADVELSIISHSQGGVLATYMMREFAAKPKFSSLDQVKNIVTLDSPLQGINSWSAKIVKDWLGKCGSYPPSHDSAFDMQPGSDVVKRINGGGTLPKVILFTVNEKGWDCIKIGPIKKCGEIIDDEHSKTSNSWELDHLEVNTGDHSTVWMGNGDPLESSILKRFIDCAVTRIRLPGQCKSYAESLPIKLGPSQSSSQSFNVRGGASTFSSVTEWGGSTVTTTLISPSGRVIDGNTIALDVGHDSGATFEMFEVTHPEPGDWTVELFGADVPPGGEEVFLSIVATPDASVDADGDLVWDDVDNCPGIPNSTQFDADNDGLGDACDDDNDNDGVLNADDNCEFVANAGQEDLNGNGIGDACDPALNDFDGDGVLDGVDSCPLDANADQSDADSDGLGDACDDDFVLAIPTATSAPTATPAPAATPTPEPTPTATAPVLAAAQAPAPTPTPAVLAATALPVLGGEPPEGGFSVLPWLAAIAGIIAIAASGSFWLALKARRVR